MRRVVAREQTAGNDAGETETETDVGIHLLDQLVAGIAQDVLPARHRQFRRDHAKSLQLLIEHLLAQQRRFVMLDALQVMANLAACTAGLDGVQPCQARVCIGSGDDLDPVAIGQLGHQRHRLEIDVGGDAVVADIRVHGVRQVDRRRTARQGDDLALRREDVNLVRKQVDLDMFEKVAGLVGRTLQIEQRVKPGGSLLLQVGAKVFAVLVQPVGGDAFLRQVVHRLGPNLQFEGGAVRSDQRRMQ
ncbi:MAG: hypothetical protein AW07_02147 [Candidatus Accumulibacter sp. SK-11]|nr:MAG: hypothetical protein AW07_02147 [Candidatus Accumulibacter sp. SK-11]